MVIKNTIEQCGFQIMHQTNEFKCAFITYSKDFAYGKVTEIKRHRESDEVFILMSGKATLLTGNPENKEYMLTDLQIGNTYCVTAGTWHYLAITEETLVFVVENGGVSKANSDAISVELQQLYMKMPE